MSLDSFDDPDSFYDADEVVPITSPLLRAVHPRLGPVSAPAASVKCDPNVDDYGLDTPWEPSLRVSGRVAIYAPKNVGIVLPSPVDTVLLDQMSNGRLPYIGWEAQKAALASVPFPKEDYQEYMTRDEISNIGSNECANNTPTISAPVQLGDLQTEKHHPDSPWRLRSWPRSPRPLASEMPSIAGINSTSSPQQPYNTYGMPSPVPVYTPYQWPNANGYVPRSSQYYTDALGSSPHPIFDEDSPPATPNVSDTQEVAPTRKRWGIPLSLSGRNSNATVMSCVDSGADDNTMTLGEAHRLGLPMTSEAEDAKEFCLANGTTIRSLGKVMSSCTFAQGSASTEALTTFFYVFQNLVEPVIIGLRFLELTETLSKYRDRLVELDVPHSRPLRVLSIGVPRRNLFCRLDDDRVFANADSGSDLDFISKRYATSRNISISPNEERIMFADGSVATTSGTAMLQLSVGDVELDAKERFKSTVTVSRKFHIFEGMVHDVLIGHATIEKLHVFTRFNSSLLPGFGLLGSSSLNIIRHLKKISALKGIKEFLQRGIPRHSRTTTSSNGNDQEDHWENARRSAEMERIEALDDPVEAARARAAEDLRHQGYMANRQIGDFVCTIAGCNAMPFPTQYLLNCHANVHPSARPHYCPVKGCPRSEGGKGFERKNQLIRHGLVHETPGYVCPFCPNRKHNYPRPDNLQRHVRIHHTDKDEDDLQLREVLAQRPDGPNRYRRRKV